MCDSVIREDFSNRFPGGVVLLVWGPPFEHLGRVLQKRETFGFITYLPVALGKSFIPFCI
jgi:hypothetical protein